MNYLTKQEEFIKNVEIKFYETTNRELANKIINSKKVLYFTENQQHFKNKNKIVTVFYFEMCRELWDIVNKYKAEKRRGKDD